MSVALLERAKLPTAEDLWLMPGNGSRRELVRGVVREMPPAGGEHGEIAGDLYYFLAHHVKSRRLGRVVAAEIGFVIAHDPDTVRAPDCAFLSNERAPDRLPKRYVEAIPDLVVEVVSPDDRAEEVSDKVDQWLRAGVRMVWVVHPRTRIVVTHRPDGQARILREGDTLSGDEVVPGFELAVGRLFE